MVDFCYAVSAHCSVCCWNAKICQFRCTSLSLVVFQMTGGNAVPGWEYFWWSWFWGTAYGKSTQTWQQRENIFSEFWHGKPSSKWLPTTWHISRCVGFVLMGDPSQVEVSSYTNTSQWLPPLRTSKSNKWWPIRSHCKFCPAGLMDGQV